MSRAVSFRLNDPGAMLEFISKLVAYITSGRGSRPIIYQSREGELCCSWTKHQVDPRYEVTLGYATMRQKDNKKLKFYGPFFVDCEDEIRDLCQQLGVRCEIVP